MVLRPPTSLNWAKRSDRLRRWPEAKSLKQRGRWKEFGNQTQTAKRILCNRQQDLHPNTQQRWKETTPLLDTQPAQVKAPEETAVASVVVAHDTVKKTRGNPINTGKVLGKQGKACKIKNPCSR